MSNKYRMARALCALTYVCGMISQCGSIMKDHSNAATSRRRPDMASLKCFYKLTNNLTTFDKCSVSVYDSRFW